MSIELTKDLLSILDGIRGENLNGHWATEDWVKKQFAFVGLKDGQTLSGALRALAAEGHTLRFRYNDEDLYVVNERYPVSEVLDKAIDQETAAIRDVVSHNPPPEEARRLEIRQSLLNSIRDSLSKALANHAQLDGPAAEKILTAHRKVARNLESLILDGSKKFAKSFEDRDLPTRAQLNRYRHQFVGTPFAQVLEILDALAFNGKIVVLPLADHEKGFLSNEVIDSTFLLELDRRKKSTKSEAEKKGGNAENLKEYHDYLFFANLSKVITEHHLRALGDETGVLDFKTLAIPNGPEAPSVPLRERPETVATARTGATASTADFKSVGTETEEVFSEVGLEQMAEEKLEEELMKNLRFDASRSQLRETIGGLRVAKDDRARSSHARTLFSCLALVAGLPEDGSERIRLIAKVLLRRLGGQLDPMLRAELDAKLEASVRLRGRWDRPEETRTLPPERDWENWALIRR